MTRLAFRNFVFTLQLVCFLHQKCSGFSFNQFLPASDSGKIQVRKARIPKDLPAIQSCRQTFADPGRSQFLQAERDFMLARSLINNPRTTCIIAEERQQNGRTLILGTAEVKVAADGTKGLVNNVYVRKDAQGRGIGKKLMAETTRLLAEDGLANLSLQVDTSNTAAMTLYERVGFQAPSVYAALARIGKVSGLNLRIEMAKELN